MEQQAPGRGPSKPVPLHKKNLGLGVFLLVLVGIGVAVYAAYSSLSGAHRQVVDGANKLITDSEQTRQQEALDRKNRPLWDKAEARRNGRVEEYKRKNPAWTKEGPLPDDCPKCTGLGLVATPVRKEKWELQGTTTCKTCGGTGVR